MQVERTDEEIQRVRNKAHKGANGRSSVPGMTYEEGINDVLGWLFGDYDEEPLEDVEE